MFRVKSASENETPRSKLGSRTELGFPSSRVEVRACVKRRRRFLLQSCRSCSKVLDAKAPVTDSRESNEAENQGSHLPVLLEHGDLALSCLTSVVDLRDRDLCRNNESLLGVSHQLTTECRGGTCTLLESLPEPLTGSLGVTESLRFSFGVSLNSTGVKDLQPGSTALVL